MSGYLGNPDAESEHALILSENGVHAAREAMQGSIHAFCLDSTCGEAIPNERMEAARKNGMKCLYCIVCQARHDGRKQVKMLDRIL